MAILQKLFKFLRDKENRESLLALATILTVLGGGIAWGVKFFHPDNSEKAPTSQNSLPTTTPATTNAKNSHSEQEATPDQTSKNNIIIKNSPIFTGNNANVTINQKN